LARANIAEISAVPNFASIFVIIERLKRALSRHIEWVGIKPTSISEH
jgi:hypothetical protein